MDEYCRLDHGNVGAELIAGLETLKKTLEELPRSL